MTLKGINAALAGRGLPVRIARGRGYFYFYPRDGAPAGRADCVPSVYVMRLHDLTLTQWIEHVADHFNQGDDQP